MMSHIYLLLSFPVTGKTQVKNTGKLSLSHLSSPAWWLLTDLGLMQ